MSDFRGHVNAGLVATLIVLAMTAYVVTFVDIRWYLIPIAMCTSFIFSLFPDIDVKSTSSRILYSAIIISMITLYVLQMYKILSLIAIVVIIPQLVKHRGIFHSKLFSILIPAILFYPYFYGIVNIQEAVLMYVAGVIGYQTHLIADA